MDYALLKEDNYEITCAFSNVFVIKHLPPQKKKLGVLK